MTGSTRWTPDTSCIAPARAPSNAATLDAAKAAFKGEYEKEGNRGKLVELTDQVPCWAGHLPLAKEAPLFCGGAFS
jgi:hypothetical protein